MDDYKSKLINIFNSDWYLKRYPDVAQGNINPFDHFDKYGRFENRQPFHSMALELEAELLDSDTETYFKHLADLSVSPDIQYFESIYALWIVARWHSMHGNWQAVLKYINEFKNIQFSSELIPHLGPVLLEFSALLELQMSSRAEVIIDNEIENRGALPDLLLAKVNMAGTSEAISILHKLYSNHGLIPLQKKNLNIDANIDNITSVDTNGNMTIDIFKNLVSPCISIIIPACNSERTIGTAIESIQQQTWKNLDIIVVDDASTDNTINIIKAFMANDKRIRLICNDFNQGAYTCRNKGLQISKGKFITVHDSDDWSHPEKIERQVIPLIKNSKLTASVSHWVRCEPNLTFFHWRIETGWIYRNISSLMFKRSVFKKLGYWDRVRVGADTEYYYRIRKQFGDNSILEVLPGIPLSFGRHSRDSLSQHHNTHLLTTIKGVRRDYQDAAHAWHLSSGNLYLSFSPKSRPFFVPTKLLVPPNEEIVNKHYKLMLRSTIFDRNWYLQNYPDLALSGDDPVMHYLLHGGYEGRDPGPNFSSSGYTYQYLKDYPEIINPLAQYLIKGQQEGNQALPEIPGNIDIAKNKKTVLICAHSSGTQIFGAERSLLDILDGINAIGLNAVVSVPQISNEAYIDEIQARYAYLKVLPYPWWQFGRTPCSETLNHFEELLDRFNIDAVYSNTLMLWEPLLAARSMNIPNFVHIRELPEQDPDLCNVLNASPDQIKDHVLENADNLIANSQMVSQYFAAPDKTHVVHNLVNVEKFDMPNSVQEGVTTVAMISSNIPKKGIEDFFLMAEKLDEIDSNIKCLLIGPANEHVQNLIQNGMPDNLEIKGYLPSPQEALSEANIVINLSHFQESFGRTILEAMAASRCVIGYNWGALSELIRDGKNGYLVPYRDIDSLINKIRYLHNNPDLIIKMGITGREIAESDYGFNHFSSQLKEALTAVLKG